MPSRKMAVFPLAAIVILSISGCYYPSRMHRPQLPAALLTDGRFLPVDTISNYEIVLRMTSRPKSDTADYSTPVEVGGQFECFYFCESNPFETGQTIPFLKIEDVRRIIANDLHVAVNCTLIDSGSYEEVYPDRYAGPVYRIQPIILPSDTVDLKIGYSAVLVDPYKGTKLSWNSYDQRLKMDAIRVSNSLAYWLNEKQFQNPF